MEKSSVPNINDNKKDIRSELDNNKSQSSHKDKKYDTINFRMDFIKQLLKDTKLEPVVCIDNEQINTENFVHPNGFNSVSGGSKDDGKSNDSSSYDTRVILNKQMHDFYKVVNEIGGKIKYFKSGTTGHTFMGVVNPESGANINYAIKVVAYPKKERYGDMNDIRRPENAELMMIRLLSYFVIKKQTPHIVLPIGTFYTSIKPFVNLIEDNVVAKDNKKYLEFVDKYKKKEYYDDVSILISEWANRGDLLDFIKNNYREFKLVHWKVIFFQIISVLAVIQSKFPSFRHNDLKANNVLVHKITQRGTVFSYVVVKKKYVIPNIGYIIKLWDFDFACIPGIVDNAKVSARWTDEINVQPVQHRYYDLHYFFNTLIKKGFFPELLTDPGIPKEVKDFVYRIVPSKYQHHDGVNVAERGRLLVSDEYAIPENILKNDPFFEEFRNHKFKKDKNNDSQKTEDGLSKQEIPLRTPLPQTNKQTSVKKYILSNADAKN